MERIILHLLDFGLSGPSCYTFLHLLAQASATTACARARISTWYQQAQAQRHVSAVCLLTNPACMLGQRAC
jgi:hypothetical protein